MGWTFTHKPASQSAADYLRKRILFTLPNHSDLLVRLRRDNLARYFAVIDAARRQEERLAA